MSRDHPQGAMELDPRTFQQLSLLVALLLFAVAALGITGVSLGWGDDVGAVLTIVGTLGGLLVGWSALVIGSTQVQVGRVHRVVVDNGRTLGKLDKLDEVQLTLDRQTGVLDEQLAVLRTRRDSR